MTGVQTCALPISSAVSVSDKCSIQSERSLRSGPYQAEASPNLGRQNSMHFVNCHETSAPTVEFESYSLRWLPLNDRVHQTRANAHSSNNGESKLRHKVMMDLRVRQKDQLLRIHNRFLTSMSVQKSVEPKRATQTIARVARKLLNSIGAR